MVKVPMEQGYYEFKLDDLLKKRGITIYRLTNDTNTDYKVVKRLLDGENTRLDVIVLARLCVYFDCNISDIVEYYK